MTPALEPAPRGAFVEASAGTGKTYTLVTEIANAIASGIPVDRIAAVTFTHAAAGSMKVRVRQELERRQNQEEALRRLDRAFIGTIHGFCAHLLRQRPVEACVDPDFKELDDPNARALFDTVFQEWLASKLNNLTPVLRRALTRLAWVEERTPDGPAAKLRDAAWRLVEWRDHDAPWVICDVDLRSTILALFERIKRLDGMLRVVRRPTDPLAKRLGPVREARARIRRAKDAGAGNQDDVENEILALPFRITYLDDYLGSGDWGGNVDRADVVTAWRDLKDAIGAFRLQADADLASRLRPELWEVVELYQREKQRMGSLDFQDLLIHARDLLAHPAAASDLRARYDRLFIDEFQDTDPLQSEILLSLCRGNGTESPGLADRLFVVGDPKQSIYRFRRADAREYSRIRAELLAAGLTSRQLQEGRRATDALHRFVNAAFEHIPDALPLIGGTPALENQPAVVALPIPYLHTGDYRSAKTASLCAPDTTAAFVQWLRSSGWKIRNESDGVRRDVRLEDICILFKNTVSYDRDLMQEYARALEMRGIGHVLVGSKSFHRREEIGTLRVALQAIEWPDDELSVYAVLRGALFFIPDSDLFKFRQSHGRFTPFFRPPTDIDPAFRPIAAVLALLRKLHRSRNYRPPAETIRRLLDGARAHVGLAFHAGGERHLANVYRFCDLARNFEASRPGSFRSFVEFLDAEYESGEQAEAAVLEQAGGVRLMNVHKAKGLEFPVVILVDMTTSGTFDSGCERYVDPSVRLCAQKLCSWSPWEVLEHQDEENEELRAEAVRLSYVAATRAKDLLVVSASGMGPWQDSWLTPLYTALYPEPDRWTTPDTYPHIQTQGHGTVFDFPRYQENAVSVRPGMYDLGGGNHVFWFDPRMLPAKPEAQPGLHRGALLDGTEAQRAAGMEAWQAWQAARIDLIEAARQPTIHTVLASEARVTPEADQIPFELVSVDWQGQRPASRNFGILVHILLESWNLAATDQLAELHGRRIGATEREIETAAALARATMQHPLVNPANAVEIHREHPICVALASGEIVEGVIDVAWSDGARWTVVDYKTGRAERRHQAQVQLYALAIQQATGLPARAIVLDI